MELGKFFYTVGQVAELFCVTRVTVWRWTKEGKLSAQYIGREAIIPKWEVELLLESRAHKKEERQENRLFKEITDI